MEDSMRTKELSDVSSYRDKNERLAWKRKLKKLQELIESMEPYESKILELMSAKQHVFDEVQELRKIMVKDCVHPLDYLVHKDSYVECKFCNAKIRLIRHE